MNKEQKLYRLLEKVICLKKLTTKELHDCNFNSRGINELVEDGTVIKLKRGEYKFVDDNKLDEYASKLLQEENYDKVEICYQTCYSINPNNSKYLFVMIYSHLKLGKYKEAFKYFVDYKNTGNFKLCDYNILLNLFSKAIELPEKYENYLKTISLNDYYNPIGITNEKQRNSIYLNVLKNDFTVANSELKEIYEIGKDFFTVDILLKKLILINADIVNKRKMVITNYIKNKKYREALKMLMELKCEKKLSPFELQLNILLEEILTNDPSKKIYYNENKVYRSVTDALRDKNFAVALTMQTEKIEIENVKENENMIYSLLIEINNLHKKNPKIIVASNDIIDALKRRKFDIANEEVEKYLKIINKSEYSYLVYTLINIEIRENNNDFTKTKNILNSLNSNNYTFNVAYYINKFEYSLFNNNVDLAQMYLEIVKTASIKKHTKCDASELQINYELYNLNQIGENNKSLDYLKRKLYQINSKEIIVLNPFDIITQKLLISYLDKLPSLSYYIIGDDNKKIVIKKQKTIKNLNEINFLLGDADNNYLNGNYKNALEKYLEIYYSSDLEGNLLAKIGLTYIKLKNKFNAIYFLKVAIELTNDIKLQNEYKNMMLNLKNDIQGNTARSVYDVDKYTEIYNLILKGKTLENACSIKNLNTEQKLLCALFIADKSFEAYDKNLGTYYISLVESYENKSYFVEQTLLELKFKINSSNDSKTK